MMKYIVTLILLISCSFSYGQDSTTKREILDRIISKKKIVGEKFRIFSLTTPEQTTFSNANLTDKIVFVNFWFDNCPPCISELAGLNKLYDTLKDNKNFIFVSFTFDPDSTTNKLKAKYNIQYQVFHITRAECQRLNFNNGFPTSFILDKQGVIKYIKVGGQTDEEKSTEDVMKKIYPKILKQL